MQFFDNYEDVVATGELSGGNDSVGDMWTVTKTFSKDTPIETIIRWARRQGLNGITGKLIITIDEPETIP